MPIEIKKPIGMPRQWGEEKIIARSDVHVGKALLRKAGTKGGYQIHVKEELHYLAAGMLRLRTADGEQVVHQGESWTVPPMTPHQEEAITDCLVIEVGDPTINDRFSLEPDPGGLPSMTVDDAVTKLLHLSAAFENKAQRCAELADKLKAEGFPVATPA